MNPGQGLKIAPFKDAHLPQAMADRELDKLARYMVHIATTHEDFRKLNHKVCDEPVGVAERRTLMLSELRRTGNTLCVGCRQLEIPTVQTPL